ncbi:MAG: class I SAM-dependent methyltransferase [Patescibacteria group bacterium]|nr:class I SAM-dependent methyltransferase [Patescibacteria group bacterium]
MNEKNWNITPDEESKLSKDEINEKGNPENKRTFEKDMSGNEDMTKQLPLLELEEQKRELKKTREDIQNIPNQNKENKTEEESKIKLSPGGRVVKSINNMRSAQEVRDKTAEKKVPEVIRALEEIYGSLENVKRNIKTIIDIGSGWGENLSLLVEKLKAEKGTAIDKNADFSQEVKNKFGNKLAMVNGDALKEIKYLESKDVDMSTAFAFLQVLSEEEKVQILKKMGEISDLVVVVDELKRDGLKGLKDWAMNKAFNAGDMLLEKSFPKYKVLKKEGWEETFEKAGLSIKVFNKFGNNDFVAVLKKVEEKVKE